jgi:thiamine-phosphate pyrophosphorylase
MPLPSPALLVISDRRQARLPLERIAEAAFAGGCRWFSLREKDLAPAERRLLLERLVAIGRAWGATVGVHDDLDSAAATGAAALHLPTGGDPAAARARLGARLIGVSAHSPEAAAAAFAAGADYVTASPVFATASKPGYEPSLGLDGLAAVAAAAPGPVLALAGVNPGNAGSCLAAGAHGVAVMGEVMRAAQPRATVEALLQALLR